MSVCSRRARFLVVSKKLVLGGALTVAVMGCHGAPSAPLLPSSSETSKRVEDPAAILKAGQAALAASDYPAAEVRFRHLLARSEQEKPAQIGLAEVLFQTGRLTELLELSRKEGLTLWQGRALLALGRPEEVTRLAGGEGDPILLELLRGEAYLELGRRADAEEIFQKLTTGWPRSDGTPLAPELAERQRAVARAAFLLRDPKLADRLFGEARELGPRTSPSRLWEAELYIERHDVEGALSILGDFLEHAPNHPEALLLLAQLKRVEHFDFVLAEGLAQRALEISPNHPSALFTLGAIALVDLDFAEVEKFVARGLGRNPRSLELLALRAATALLAERPEEFERLEKEFRTLAPDSARLLSITSELAEWEHRYSDIETLTRRAARLDPKDPVVRSRLALTLLRSGSEAQGLVELRRAFALDPYDVRTYNSLTLFEDIIPEEYETHEVGIFRFRFPKAEAKLLLRYVPELASAAISEFEKRYQMRAPRPITIELYKSRQDFAVRTSGLTHVGLEGVCFGQRIAALTPAAGPGNLGMTLWHELAHVFHLTASAGRIPRWLTEGFAEWETERLDRGWGREAERALFIAERKGSLPGLFQMNRAFTRARNHNDIRAAYLASGALARFIDETRPELFPAWLRELGARKPAADVLRSSLPDPDAFMSDFQRFLRARLQRFETQFILDEPEGLTGAQLSPVDSVGSEDAARYAREESAFALAAAGELAEAQRALFDLWESSPNPRVGLALARLALQARDPDGARELLDRSIELGPDGVELRLERARLAAMTRDFSALRTHARRATELDPQEIEAWALLASAEHQVGTRAMEIDALARWAELDEGSAVPHVRLIELLLEAGRSAEAAKAADRALWVALGDARLHELAARAFEKAGDRKRAAFERETAGIIESVGPSRTPAGAR